MRFFNKTFPSKLLHYLFDPWLIGFFGLCIYGLHAQSPTIESAGDVLLFVMPATALGSSLAAKDHKGTWQFTKGFLLNQGVTLALKQALNKPRPFNNGDKAFPSGHTSTAFQSAAFVQKRYGWQYGIPAFFLAGFTGYSRINAQKHDGWDVLAGALVGIGSAYVFTSPYQKKHMSLTFSRANQGFVIGFKYEF